MDREELEPGATLGHEGEAGSEAGPSAAGTPRSKPELLKSYTASGEAGLSYVPSAVHGEGEELLIKAKSAVEMLDLESLDEILPTFEEVAARARLIHWEPFYETALSVRELLSLRSDVKRAIKERDLVVLQYSRDKVLDAKVAGVADNIRKKVPYFDAEESLSLVALDKEGDEAFETLDETRLEEAMARAREAGHGRTLRKLEVLMARCKWQQVEQRREERQQRAKKAAMRAFKPQLKQGELEELRRREEEGNAVFLQWKKEKDAEERAKMARRRKQRTGDEEWIMQHEAELRELNEQAFEMWLRRKDQQREQEIADELEQIEFFRLVETIKKSRDVINAANNVERRVMWDSDSHSGMFPSAAEFRAMQSKEAAEGEAATMTASQLSLPGSNPRPYATGAPFVPDALATPYAEPLTTRSATFNFILSDGRSHSVPM